MSRKSSAVRKPDPRNLNLVKAREALAAKRAAANSTAPTAAIVLDADIVGTLQLVAAVNGETPSAVIRRMFANVRKPGAKA
jgi:hypothetical protein